MNTVTNTMAVPSRSDDATAGSAILPHIVEQHAEETLHLVVQRRHLLHAGGIPFVGLGRLDERLAAHVDGLRVAEAFGRAVTAAMATADEVPLASRFAVGVLALEAADAPAVAALLPRDDQGGLDEGMRDALGWVSPVHLRGLVASWLRSGDRALECAGVVACQLHRTDPGGAIKRLLATGDAARSIATLNCVAAIGRSDTLDDCRAACRATDRNVRFAGARAGVLLGDRTECLRSLALFTAAPESAYDNAARLAFLAMSLAEAHAMLKNIASVPTARRELVEGAGFCGDPLYVPWLIKQMEDAKLTRLAGESFSTITGLDLAYLDLERKPPDNFESGPNDNPDDPNVEMDEDDGLPWPDPEKCAAWWKANKHRFQEGVRYFMGKPPSREHCIEVLKTGYQRQRIAAAQYLCLLNPGTPLFNTSAPAWRQQRWLTKMS